MAFIYLDFPMIANPAGNETNIVIPSIIDGVKVVEISEYAFNS